MPVLTRSSARLAKASVPSITPVVTHSVPQTCNCRFHNPGNFVLYSSVPQSSVPQSSVPQSAVQPTNNSARRSIRIYENDCRKAIASFDHLKSDQRAYEVVALRYLLTDTNTTTIEHRKVNAYFVCQFISENTLLIRTNERFRQTVASKMTRLNEEANKNVYSMYTDKVCKAIVDVQRILETL